MKSIKSNIILVILAIVILLCAMFGTVSCILNYRTAVTVLEQNLRETAVISADRVAAEIKSIENVAVQTGTMSSLADPNVPVETKKLILEQQSKTYGFQRGNLLSTEGISYFDGNDYSERDYFKAAMQGQSYISDPTLSKITGKTTFLIAAPLWKDGRPDTTIIGVIYFAPDENFLNDIVANINISKSGYAYLLNKDGTVVADLDIAMVGVENTIAEAKADSSLKALAAIETRMIQGETGYEAYHYKGEQWVQGFTSVKNTNNWSIAVVAQEKDFLTNFYLTLMVTIVLMVVFIGAGLIAATIFANKIGKPLKICSDRILKLSNGDLTSSVPTTKRQDETGILMKATKRVVESLNEVVDDITHVLSELAEGNLSVSSSVVHTGDFVPIQVATEKIILSLNEAMRGIRVSSDQVSNGSEQVSSGAQILAQGATEQASSIEELSAAISEISAQVKQNAENANNANRISTEAGNKLMEGNEEMKRMVTAMDEINKSSNKISNIIKTINDIAFQTNILALNAAVEAARAGVAGKGFAVVADEVRNLASKSAAAAKDTTGLIETSMKAVKDGSDLANSTASILLEVMDGAKQSTALVGSIASASNDQALSITQITQGVDQISAVVQTNSATAEESAAASEELSGQAQMLKNLVGKFKIKGE